MARQAEVSDIGDMAVYAKEKSRAHPSIPLEDCIDFVRRIERLGGRRVSDATLLKDMKLNSPNTRGYHGRISSCNQFGLSVRRKDFIELSERSMRILHPVNPQSKKNEIWAAFLSPPIYRQLFERYDGGILPDEDTLSNILFHEYGISTSAKDDAAAAFIASARFAGAMRDDGVFRDPAEQAQTGLKADEQVSPSSVGMLERARVNITDDQSPLQTALGITEYHVLRVVLGDGLVAELKVPVAATEKQIRRLIRHVELLIPEPSE